MLVSGKWRDLSRCDHDAKGVLRFVAKVGKKIICRLCVQLGPQKHHLGVLFFLFLSVLFRRRTF